MPNIKNAITGKVNNNKSALYSMALLGTLVASIITIWTVSSIGQIAPLLTFVLGAGVANVWVNKSSAAPTRRFTVSHA